jgi:phosphoglycolate phosphatase-like HAD superfamily hydrolase
VIEIIHASASAARAKAVIFDFDGTLSLIRSGWVSVMVPLCVEQLANLNTGERREELQNIVEEFVWRLTGKETIYQMMALADAVRARGGNPMEPLVYKRMYLEALWLKIRDRVEGLRAGRLNPEQYMVPGAREVLDDLARQGLRLYLASGTDDANVKEEAGLLGISHYFGERIYGAQDDLNSFSKALLVRRILARTGGLRPDELLVFGDGYVEIEEVKKVGGIAVGVATAEPECQAIDEWKRQRLMGAGADFIVPNYLRRNELFSALFQVTVST